MADRRMDGGRVYAHRVDLGVALIGGLVGGTVAAIIGGYITLQAQGRQHTHEREMAREARLQERRARAYERILEHLYRLDAWVSRTAPLIEPAPDPPPPLPEEELFRLNALTAAYLERGPDARARHQENADRLSGRGLDARRRAGAEGPGHADILAGRRGEAHHVPRRARSLGGPDQRGARPGLSAGGGSRGTTG